MKRKRAHVFLPGDLLAEVDELVGPRGRSAFLTQVIRDEVNRRRLLHMLRDPEPFFGDENYPQFRDGGDAWVQTRRDEDSRLEREKLGNWLHRGGNDNLPH